MKELQERILQDGQVREGDILKVDNFLNHQIDPVLLDDIGREFAHLYEDEGITKVLTIEASGIAIAVFAAYHIGVPLVFAKKAKSQNIDGDVYTSEVESFTYKRTYNITVAQKFINSDDKVLIIDDFMASGKAMDGLLDVCKQAGAEVAGIGICIEKGFQGGGDALRLKGYRVDSLAIIDNMGEDGIMFRRGAGDE